MKDLFKKRVASSPEMKAQAAARRLTLAAFGKHPGWDDHMPGIGVETETLAYAKQTLYVNGIGRQIDAAAWEKLEAEKRLEGFGHTFLWLRDGHVILGLIWSSKDGKGRSKYPMILAVDGESVSPDFILGTLRGGLESLREVCKTATTSVMVTGNCRAAQEQLQFTLNELNPVPGDSVPSPDTGRFLDNAHLGPDRIGLLRVLHVLGGAFDLSGKTRQPLRGTAGARSLHLRVPLASESENESLLLWASFLASAVGSAMPLLLISRTGTDWLDAILNDPVSDDFFCLQASLKGLPLASQIPYQLTPESKQRLTEVESRFLAAMVEKQVVAEPPPLPVPSGPVPIPAVAPKPSHSVMPPPAPAKNKMGVLVISVAAIAVMLIILLVLSGGNGNQYASAMKSAQDAFATNDYSNTVQFAQRALAQKPGDAQATQLQDHARTQMEAIRIAEAKYQSAMKDARAAIAHEDFSNALVLVNSALSVRTNDANAIKLRDSARTRLDEIAAVDTKYQTAMKNAQTAFARSDFSNAAASANVAFSVKANDREASRLRDSAQAKLSELAAVGAKYQAAIKEARASFDRGDYSNAMTLANNALSIKSDSRDALQLREDVQRKLDDIASTHAKYRTALKEGRVSFANQNFSRALEQANVAIAFALVPKDPDAVLLRDSAKAKLDEMTMAATAIQSASAAFDRGDFTETVVQANKALAIQANNPDAAKLRDDAQSRLAASAPATTAAAQINANVAPATDHTAESPNPPSLVEPAASLTNSFGMEFVWIEGLPGGGAFVGKYDVTQKQYRAVMNGIPAEEQVTQRDDIPVANITFDEATRFCQMLTQKENKPYSLPSKKQWLAMAGMSDLLPQNEINVWKELEEKGVIQREVTSSLHDLSGPEPVGKSAFQTNGLYDLFGNVREWTSDQFRAGFGYNCKGRGNKQKMLFLDRTETDGWIQQATGFRCLLKQKR